MVEVNRGNKRQFFVIKKFLVRNSRPMGSDGAQMGERSSGDREVPGSIPGVSRSSEWAPQQWQPGAGWALAQYR